MLVQPTLLVIALLALRATAAANSNRLLSFQPLDVPVQSPSASPVPKNKPNRDSPHISDFTDPDTGLNPFLDLQEGRTGAFGRRFKEKDRPLPKPYLPPDSEVTEGDGHERSGIRAVGTPSSDGGEKRQPSWQPSSFDYPGEIFDFDLFAEPSVAVVVTEVVSVLPEEESSLTTSQVPPGGSAAVEFGDVVESVTSEPENPFMRNVTVSAVLTGSAVALVALVIAVIWKRRLNRTSAAAYAEQGESRNCTDGTQSTRDSSFRK